MGIDDKAENKAQEMYGKAEQKVGKATGDDRLQEVVRRLHRARPNRPRSGVRGCAEPSACVDAIPGTWLWLTALGTDRLQPRTRGGQFRCDTVVVRQPENRQSETTPSNSEEARPSVSGGTTERSTRAPCCREPGAG